MKRQKGKGKGKEERKREGKKGKEYFCSVFCLKKEKKRKTAGTRNKNF